MKNDLTRTLFAVTLGISLTACIADTESDGAEDEQTEGDGAEDEQTESDESAIVNVPFSRFSFGAQTASGAAPKATILESANWVMRNGFQPYHKSDLQKVKDGGKVPYLYFYIAADTARQAGNLHDCNVSGSGETLCKAGAYWVRQKRTAIVDAYRAAAIKVQSVMGTKPILVHIEPDFYQYTTSTQTKPLSFVEVGSMLNSITSVIHEKCSSCNVVIDASTWADDLRGYYAHVDQSKVQFVGLVGATINATSGWLPNYSFADLTAITGKRLIVNTAHGPGGAPTPYNSTWEGESRLRSMWNAGVVAVIQSSDQAARYGGVMQQFTSNPIAGARVPPTSFDFKTASGVGGWWMQLDVHAPPGRTVTKVTAKVGTTVYTLEKKSSWGRWTWSGAPAQKIPKGTQVLFTATDDAGRTSTWKSAPWP